MGVKLSNIAANSATVEIPIEDEMLHVTYYPGRITDETMLSILAFEDMDEHTLKATLGEFNSALASIVKSWDLLEDDGETPIALEPKRLAQVYLPLKLIIYRAILGHMRPNQDAPQIQNGKTPNSSI